MLNNEVPTCHSQGDLPAVQLNDNLARSVVIDLLELANVACREYIVS